MRAQKRSPSRGGVPSALPQQPKAGERIEKGNSAQGSRSMAKFVSATDFAIALAARRNTLSLIERPSRLGGTFIAISDEFGVIEVADDMASAQKRVQEVGQ